MNKRVLVVDDQKSIRESLEAALEDNGYDVYTYDKGKGLLEKVKSEFPYLIILDIKLPDIDGIKLLGKIIDYDPEILVIMITAYGDTRKAVKSIKKGAYDYIEKPFDLDELLVTIKNAFGTKELKDEVKLLKKQQKEYLGDSKLIAESSEMKQILKKIKVLAKKKVIRVLITGETGVGKDIIARKIHEMSRENNIPFVKINCGAIPSNLIESELFGHEKNAFTGANQLKKGLIEIADGGTVFLDEIGELPLNTQVKILRFLEEKKFKRVGGIKDISVNVRIIAATNKNLEKEIKNNNFRKDLFYRLNVVRINVPPLRNRKADIMPLASYFLRHFNKKLGKKVKGFSEPVKNTFLNYDWPGNVRELKNMIERMLIFRESNNILNENQLPGILNKDGVKESIMGLEDNEINWDKFSLEKKLERLEVSYIKKALQHADGKKTEAARLLDISRYSLYRRIDKYELE